MLRSFGDLDSLDYSIARQSIEGINYLNESEDWLDRSGIIVVAD
jgi:hypothetical protein